MFITYFSNAHNNCQKTNPCKSLKNKVNIISFKHTNQHFQRYAFNERFLMRVALHTKKI